MDDYEAKQAVGDAIRKLNDLGDGLARLRGEPEVVAAVATLDDIAQRLTMVFDQFFGPDGDEPEGDEPG